MKRSLIALLFLATSASAQVPPLSGPPGTYQATLVLAVAGPLPAFAGTAVGPAGTYAVTTSGPTTITQTATSYTISWAVGPPIPPNPPPPVIQTGNLYAFALFDKSSGAPSAAEAAIQTSTTLGPALSKLTATATTVWAVGDVSSPVFAQWAGSKVPGKTTLVVLAVDQSNRGTLVEAIPLPTPESAVIAELKKVRGLN